MSSRTKPVSTPGSQRPDLHGEEAASPDRTVVVTVVLRRRAALPAPSGARLLPAERPRLTHAELESRYGAATADVAQVKKFAEARGLRVLSVHAGASTMKLSGPLSAVAAAFDVDLGYEQEGARQFLDHKKPVSLPAKLKSIIRCVFGLSERRVASRPAVRQPLSTAREGAARSGEGAPRSPARARGSSSRAAGSPACISFAAPEIARYYDFPPWDGDGECLGLIELSGGFLEADMSAYFDALGIDPAPAISCVGPNTPADTLWNMEVTMDVQLAASLCPRARVVVYNAQDASIGGYYDILSRAIFDQENRPSVLSVSWSFPEIDGVGPTAEERAHFEELFVAAAHLGVTICSSTGDHGSVTPSRGQAYPVTNFAATSGWVLGCGGTTLITSDGVIQDEVVWNRLAESLVVSGDEDPATVYPMATGGGVSRWIDLPDYQRTAGVPPAVSNTWANGVLGQPALFRGRGVPDVAANADLNTGWKFFFEGAWAVGGGTSASTPLWAALLVLINQGLRNAHGPKVSAGWINPLLYRLRIEEKADVFRPITSGNNGGYEAHPTRLWNACTGLGTPKGAALAAALGALPAAKAKAAKAAKPAAKAKAANAKAATPPAKSKAAKPAAKATQPAAKAKATQPAAKAKATQPAAKTKPARRAKPV